MKLVNIVVFLFLITWVPLLSQVKNRPLPDYYGEHITYVLKVGFFQIGEVDINFRGDSVGCDAYVSASARSTGLVNFMKDVRYEFDACVDTSLGYTIQSKRVIREDDFTDYDEVHYDRTSRADSAIVVTEDFDTLIVPLDIFDIMFAFYQFRKNYISPSMVEGEQVSLHTFFVDDEWDLDIKYVGKEKLETNLGTTTCYKFLPRTEVGKFFDTEEDMSIWFTANKHRIPVLIEVDLKFATLSAEITSYTKVKQ